MGELSNLKTLRDKLSTKSEETSLGILAETGFIPENLRTTDSLRRLTSLPTVDLQELRRVVDVLSMTIMPWSYFKPEAYQEESYELQASIKRFVSDSESSFNVYVAAPVQYYDAARHVEDEEDLPIFAGHSIAPAFLAMGMALPLFRTIKRELSEIRNRANEHSRRIQDVENQIIQLGNRVDRLQAQAERQQAMQIQQNLRQAKLERELKAAESRSNFMAYEPMMIAIPKNRSIMEDGHAIVGPCWGPDFDAIVMVALKLRKYEGQRRNLESTIQSMSIDDRPNRNWY